MGQAKLYGQKTSGIDINGIIKNYYVYAGSNISAGDLVEYINGVASQPTETSVDTQLSDVSHSADAVSAVKLDDNRIFIAHSYGSKYYLYGMIISINGTTITQGTDTWLSTNTSYTGYAISTQLLSNGNIFIAHSYGSDYYLYGMIISINGTTITHGTDNKLIVNLYTGYAISTQLLSNGNIFIAHSYGSKYYLLGMIISINGTTITQGTDTQLLTNTTNTGRAISTQLLSNGNIFIAHSYDSDYYLYGMIISINGTTITQGTDTQLLTNTTYTSRAISTQLLSNGNIFIAHDSGYSNRYLYGMIISINGTTITQGTDTWLSTNTSYTGRAISTQLLSNGNIFIAHSYGSKYYLYGMIISINGTTITQGTDTQLLTNTTYTGRAISTQLLSNGNIFIAHSYGSDYYLYAQIWEVDENNVPTNQVKVSTYEQQVRPTTSSKFDGVAKTSGIGGTSTTHNQQVSIYTLSPYELTEFTSNLAPTSWTMGGG